MYDYEFPICKYCGYTDYGFAPVNTGPHNLCEGSGCENAAKSYEESTGETWKPD